MRELAALHLVTEHHPGRFILHDLVRAYAAEQADATIPANQRQAAIHRVFDYYLHTARNADAKVSPQDHPLTLSTPQDKTAPASFCNRQQAMNWFDAEYQVLLAVTVHAADAGLDTHAWQLPTAFARYLDQRGHWHDWAEVQRTALAAAQRLGDKNAQACVLRVTGGLSLRLGSYEQARDHFRQAADLYQDVGDLVGRARAHGDLAMTLAVQDRYREALALSERALDLARTAGHPHVHAATLNRVGWHAAHLGDNQRALRCCQQAMELLRDLDDRYAEATVWDSLGYIHQRQQHHTRSIDCYQRAVRLLREIGSRPDLADTLSNLGDAWHAAGEPAAARDAWRQALTILDDLHHPGAAGVRGKLHLL